MQEKGSGAEIVRSKDALSRLNDATSSCGEKSLMEAAFENEMVAESKQDSPPKDRFFLAYGIFFLQGVAMLLPWNGKNATITADWYCC